MEINNGSIFMGTSLMLANLVAGDMISIQAVPAPSFFVQSAMLGGQTAYINFQRLGP